MTSPPETRRNPFEIRRAREAAEQREKLREEARAYAEKKIPQRTLPSGKKYTTMKDVIARDQLVREYLEKNSRKR